LTRGSPAVRAVLRAGQGDECQRDGQALGPPQIDHESPGWRPWGPGRPRGGGYGIRLAAANSRRGRRRLQRARMSSAGSLCGCANRP